MSTAVNKVLMSANGKPTMMPSAKKDSSSLLASSHNHKVWLRGELERGSHLVGDLVGC